MSYCIFQPGYLYFIALCYFLVSLLLSRQCGIDYFRCDYCGECGLTVNKTILAYVIVTAIFINIFHLPVALLNLVAHGLSASVWALSYSTASPLACTSHATMLCATRRAARSSLAWITSFLHSSRSKCLWSSSPWASMARKHTSQRRGIDSICSSSSLGKLTILYPLIILLPVVHMKKCCDKS